MIQDQYRKSVLYLLSISMHHLSVTVVLLGLFLAPAWGRTYLNVAVLEKDPQGNEIGVLTEEIINSAPYMRINGFGDHVKNNKFGDHEHSKPTDEMIADAGYPSETHTVVTDDGYILKLHRIPHSPGDEYNSQRPIVFLQHGLLSSSADWVVTGPGKALAFILAKRGYDVWMGNYRGNTYSKNHVDPTITKKEFWSFSWDEMASQDLPTMLSHMMKVSGENSFYYIGHSMGTLTYFTACNYHTWIQNSTRLMIGYGAHTVVPNIVSPIFEILNRFAGDIEWISEHLGIYEVAPSNWLMDWFASEVCDQKMITQAMCKNLLFMMAGYNKHEMNTTMLPYMLGHVPAGTSVQNLVHYRQGINSQTWAGYDYEDDQLNLQHWNSTKPPTYQYNVVTAPVGLFWAENDWLVVPQDEKNLAKSLPNLLFNQRVDEKEYTHLDFLWGMHNMEKVYGTTLKVMKNY